MFIVAVISTFAKITSWWGKYVNSKEKISLIGRHFKGMFVWAKYYSSVSYCYSNFVNNFYTGSDIPYSHLWILFEKLFKEELVLCSVTFTFPLPDSIMRSVHNFQYCRIFSYFLPNKYKKKFTCKIVEYFDRHPE